MYPHDNIFNIYYNIGKRTPFLVKRCKLGLALSSSEERRIDYEKNFNHINYASCCNQYYGARASFF